MAGLPPAPPRARNVVLIVWDTVRAYNLSLYGYLAEHHSQPGAVGKKGVRYNLAVAPAPWTYPSHSCFFTGQWPFQLNSQWKFTLDTPNPTLAEYLATRGYQTAGFAANTNCCSYETGLARGFAHFEDYALTPRSLLGRTVPGKWILKNILYRGDYLRQKVDRPPIARCARDQRRLLRLAAPPAAGSSFLCLSELLRRPRAVHTPAGI